MFVKAESPSGRAKIHADDPKHALGLAQYLRTIGYSAWLEDTNGNEIDEKALKMAIRSRHEDTGRCRRGAQYLGAAAVQAGRSARDSVN